MEKENMERYTEYNNDGCKIENKPSKKRKIAKYAGISILAAALITGIGVEVYDASIDHYHEYCPLNNIFGIEHQIDIINNDGNEKGIYAHLESEKRGYIAPVGYELVGDRAIKTTKTVINAQIIKNKEGEVIGYAAPVGYELAGDKAVKTNIHEINPVEYAIPSHIDIEDNGDYKSIFPPVKTR